jgi:hypothetical protein
MSLLISEILALKSIFQVLISQRSINVSNFKFRGPRPLSRHSGKSGGEGGGGCGGGGQTESVRMTRGSFSREINALRAAS